MTLLPFLDSKYALLKDLTINRLASSWGWLFPNNYF